MAPPPPISKDQVEVLTSLLESKGMDAGDLVDAIQMLAAAKKAAGKVPGPDEDELGRKVFQEKEFIYPGLTDSWIYRNGQTKGRSWYLRVKSPGQPPFVKALGRQVVTREQALVQGQMLYQEVKGKVERGEKRVSITTQQLIKKYLEDQSKLLSPIPKAGITQSTLEMKKNYCSKWQLFINEKKLIKKKIEQINPDVGKEFAYWLQNQEKKSYKDRGWSPDYINSCICEIKRMFHKFGVDEGYLSASCVPRFKYVRAPKDQTHKRDILSINEWNQLTIFMRSNKYLKDDYVRSSDGEIKYMRKNRDTRTNRKEVLEKGSVEKIPTPISKLEKIKRRIVREYMLIAYSTGCRPSELTKMTWGDISINRMDKKEHQETHRLLRVREENSKTGYARTINAPVARRLQRLEEAYKDIGMECLPHHFIFRNPTPTRQEKNIPYAQPALTKRLNQLLILSGLQKELDATNRKITLYSQRHFYVTIRLENGVDIHRLAKNIGSSTTYIEKTYSHIETARSTEELTKGMTFIKTIEEKE